MLTKKCLPLFSLCLTTQAFAESDKNLYPGLNSTELGIQHVTYKETLKDFVDLGDLSTDISVNNTIIYASSYTNLSEKWGFMLTTQSNITKEYTKDDWRMENFGVVQTNTSKVNFSDLFATGVYHVNRQVYATFGGQLKTIGFVRSNFEAVDPAAGLLNDAIRVSDKYFTDPNPPQISSNPLAAVEEDLTYINGIAGLYYNSAFANKRRPLTWHAGGSVSLPFYVTAKNSALEQQYGIETIDESFNGYAVRLTAGLSYEFSKGLAVVFNAGYMFGAYDEMSTKFTDDTGAERTAAIPNIEVTSSKLSLGILWIN